MKENILSMEKNILNKDEVEHVANLANLTLSTSELVLYTKQLKKVFSYMEQLQKVETKAIEPTFQTIDGTTNIWREDKIIQGLSQKEALSQAKRTHDGYFVTENVFGKEAIAAKKVIEKSKRRKVDRYNAILTEVDPKGKVGHKDLFMTKGVETTAGSRVLEGYVSQYSATVVKRFEKAGYKTKYKLNQDAWGHGSSGENSDFGPTKNSWDGAKVAGGSSSGSAVVVATGNVEVATGTDTCGSIRMPASFNNVSGIKPTYGNLSRYGLIAFASSLDCPGILANDVKKLKYYYRILSKVDESDATSQSKERSISTKKGVKTIGLPKEFFGKGIDSGVKSITMVAARLLEKQGYKLKKMSLPNSLLGIAAYYLIAPTETSSNLSRFDGIRFGNGREMFGAEAKRRIMLGTFASSAGYTDKYYEKAAKVRTLIINDFKQAFKEVDVVLGPVSPTPPFRIGEMSSDPLKLYLMDIFAAPASLSGLPSLAIPCGFSKDDLPIGMQLIGPRWSEDMLFDLGEKYQKLTDWHKRTPPTTHEKE